MTTNSIQNRPIPKNSHILQFSFRSISELDELREVAHGASLEFVQLSRGRMQGHFAHMLFPKSSLHLNRFNLATRARGEGSAVRWTFLVFPPRVCGVFNGLPLDSGILIAYPPRSEFDGTILRTAEFHDWVFTVTEDELQKTYFALTRQELALLKSQILCLKPSASALSALRTFASRMMLIGEQTPRLLSDRERSQSLERQLVELLARALMTCDRNLHQEICWLSNWTIVRKTEDFLEAHVADDLCLSDLCTAAGVSERTLRRAFGSILGISPHAFLKSLRMNRAYRELQCADSEATVAAAAVRWGLTHLGRFAQEYQRFFGELPSVTLKRKVGR